MPFVIKCDNKWSFAIERKPLGSSQCHLVVNQSFKKSQTFTAKTKVSQLKFKGFTLHQFFWKLKPELFPIKRRVHTVEVNQIYATRMSLPYLFSKVKIAIQTSRKRHRNKELACICNVDCIANYAPRKKQLKIDWREIISDPPHVKKHFWLYLFWRFKNTRQSRLAILLFVVYFRSQYYTFSACNCDPLGLRD